MIKGMDDELTSEEEDCSKRRCEYCKVSLPEEEVYLTVDQFACDIYGDDMLHWLCGICYDETVANV